MTKAIQCPLVGMFFRPPAASILKCLPAGTALTLVREPHNEYDRNAIALTVRTELIPETQHENLAGYVGTQGLDLAEVLEKPSWHLGYIPKQIAATLAGVTLPETAVLGFAPDGKPLLHFNVE